MGSLVRCLLYLFSSVAVVVSILIVVMVVLVKLVVLVGFW